MFWHKANAGVLIRDYAEKSDKTIEMVKDVDSAGEFTFQWTGPTSNYLAVIEAQLRTNNIGLFKIASNRLVATWIDPTLVPKAKSIRIKKRTSVESDVGHDAALEEVLKSYNAQLKKELDLQKQPTADNTTNQAPENIATNTPSSQH